MYFMPAIEIDICGLAALVEFEQCFNASRLSIQAKNRADMWLTMLLLSSFCVVNMSNESRSCDATDAPFLEEAQV